jgi:hypothetical protein
MRRPRNRPTTKEATGSTPVPAPAITRSLNAAPVDGRDIGEPLARTIVRIAFPR